MDRAKTCPPSNPAEISPFIRLVPRSWFIIRVQLLNVCNVRPFVGEIFLWLDSSPHRRRDYGTLVPLREKPWPR
jgi:hypothetical protein